MAPQATTIIGDLRALLTALLDREPDKAWWGAKRLLEAVECAGPAGLPTRGEVAALLAELLSRELTRMVERWTGQPPPRER
jgi:hypothetical protein